MAGITTQAIAHLNISARCANTGRANITAASSSPPHCPKAIPNCPDYPPEQVQAALDQMVGIAGVQLVLFNGGTGIAPRDTTFDVIARNLDKTLPGFGEIFRMLSFQQVAAAAMLSRATAGTYRGKVIFSMPGSPNAVKLAVEQLILPEINHLAWEIARPG